MLKNVFVSFVTIMYPLTNVIHNLANQNNAPQPITDAIVEVRENFEEVQTALKKGESD